MCGVLCVVLNVCVWYAGHGILVLVCVYICVEQFVVRVVCVCGV